MPKIANTGVKLNRDNFIVTADFDALNRIVGSHGMCR